MHSSEEWQKGFYIWCYSLSTKRSLSHRKAPAPFSRWRSGRAWRCLKNKETWINFFYTYQMNLICNTSHPLLIPTHTIEHAVCYWSTWCYWVVVAVILIGSTGVGGALQGKQKTVCFKIFALQMGDSMTYQQDSLKYWMPFTKTYTYKFDVANNLAHLFFF